MFDRFNDLNIMVIGDVMVDSYMWGSVDRISPEAPIPIVSVNKRENRLGGAANVALNVQSLGARPLLCSVTGNDDRKNLFLGLMQKRGMDTSGILTSEERETTAKTRIISSSQQLLRVDEENNSKVSRNTEKQFIRLLQELLSSQKIDAVIFEDYDKGVITSGVINKIRELAAKKNIPVSADPKKRNFSHYKGINLFTPNLKELCDGLRTDVPRGDIEAISLAALKLQEANEIKYLMVTLSEMGIYLSYGKQGKLVPTEVRSIADVSGAGDTVISVATACLAAGAGPEDMTLVANLAGGLVCGEVGVVPVDRDKLLTETLLLFKGKRV